MLPVPTTITVFSDVELDEYLDEVDMPSIVSQGTPASIVQSVITLSSRDPQQRGGGEDFLVPQVTAQVPKELSIRRGQRFKDENTGEVFTVLNVMQSALPGNQKFVTAKRHAVSE